ncbi:MAG: aryl-sulfate sulfotransferase [Bryobacteraceae bacterium]
MFRKPGLFASAVLAALAVAGAPLHATVGIVSLTPSVASPQPVGTQVTWTVTATDTNPNNLTFQFNVASGAQPFELARDFNLGTESAGIWTAQPFIWTSIAGEGSYTIQVVAKDFVSGETATQTFVFRLTSRAAKKAAVSRTANPLVALFSSPACPAGSNIRVAFYTGTDPTTYTGWLPCNPPVGMNFYIAGMYPASTYTMYSQVQTGINTKNGSPLTFKTGALPKQLPGGNKFPVLTVNTAAGAGTDSTDSLIFWTFGTNTVPVATDLAAKIMWYYPDGKATLVTRVLPGGTFLSFQNGQSWNSADQELQLLREIDFAGNIVRETNTGILAYELAAMGAPISAPCKVSANPPAGTACLNDLDHEAIRYMIDGNQYTAVLAHAEQMYPAGTQGSSPSGPPVDILSEYLIVLNAQFQVVWYYDSYQQLDINRAAVLGELCTGNCQVNLLLGTVANDWTHANTIYYIASEGDFLVSLRNQDWLVKVNYNNGAGAGNILWTMGNLGDFTFNNIGSDPWPWFSHQHDTVYQNNGAGPLTVFDNGNTRVSTAPLGLGRDCGPLDCHSRGMSLMVDEANMQVTPVLSVDLGVFSTAEGSGELLFDGNYFFQPGEPKGVGIEILPTPDTLTGTEVLNISGTVSSYRAWQMPSLYAPPLN